MENILLEGLLKEFSGELVEIEAKSKLTAKQYCTDIRILLGNNLPGQIKGVVKTLKERVNSMDEWDNSLTITKNRRTSSANRFIQYLGKKENINEISRLSLRKTQKNLIKIMSIDKFTELISNIPKNNFMNLRDIAFFSLMFYNGITQEEALKIKYDDFIRKDNKIIKVSVGTGYKKRILDINDKTSKAIKKYEESYSNSNNFSGGMFFRNKHGKKLSRRSIRRKFEEYRGKIRTELPLSSLRHSFALSLVENNTTEKNFIKILGFEKDYGGKYYCRLKERKIQQ